MVSQDEEMRQDAEIDRLKADMVRLQGQVSELAQVQDRVASDVAALQSEQSAKSRAIDARLGTVERTVGDAAGERERLRQSIVSDVSQKVSTLIKTSAPAAPPARAESGYEHIVKSGETMSAIATAYKVNVNAIMQANGIKNPNSLRVGQKLFIPEH
jgi:LysM repeat protein